MRLFKEIYDKQSFWELGVSISINVPMRRRIGTG